MRISSSPSEMCNKSRGATGRGVLLAAGLLATFIGMVAPAQAADLLDRVKASKTLVIGTSNDAPLAYIDSTTKEPVGALPDVLREALRRAGIDAKLSVIALPFASLIPSLTSGRIDVIGDAMYVRPVRQEVIDFTDVVFYNPESLDVAKGNPAKIHTLSDLCGHSAGTYQGTAYIDQLKAANSACTGGKTIDIKLYPTIQNVFADLAAGRLDAAVVDGSLSAYALKENPALSFELVADYTPASKNTTNCAFGVAKGNETFLKAFNAAYATMKQDGSAAAIFAKWGLEPTSFFLNL